MRAIIYARCSTDESKQDVEVQLKQLRTYCDNNNWKYDEVSEYESGYKGVPKKLQQILNLIAKRNYQVILVHSLDRFSRLKPSLTEKMLNHITDCKCRFISLQENLDSDNQMMWYCFKGVWLYFANQYSVKLSQKVMLGMERRKELLEKEGFFISRKSGKRRQSLGRPKGSTDKKPRAKKGYYNRTYNFKGKK